MVKIESVHGRQVLDSRGNPTVCAVLTLQNGVSGKAMVPSGASTGAYEALELRDNDPHFYCGKGVQKAVQNIDRIICPALQQLKAVSLERVDNALLQLDPSQNKEKLGANATLAVSMAACRAFAANRSLPLFRYLGGAAAHVLPVPMMNILNGGAHAKNSVEIQEFMIVPVGAADFCGALRMGTEIYHTLGRLLKDRGLACGVGDEGGYAPNLRTDEEALQLLCDAIEKAGYNENQVKIALDAAASEWAVKAPAGSQPCYLLPKTGESYSSQALVAKWQRLCEQWPISSLEDGMGENDYTGWEELTRTLGKKLQLVGDDLFVTNTARLKEGIENRRANAILIKPNQIGTVSQTLQAIRAAQKAGYGVVISHRSGETEDTFIADLAVAVNAGQIKTGAPCRSERTAKYNRLLEIYDMLG